VRQVGYLQRNESFFYARKSESRIVRHLGILKYVFPVFDDDVISPFNPFQSNFSANRILPSSYLFWAVKRWWITCNYPKVLKEKNMEIQKEYSLRYLLAKVRTT
jgi:hypothetical protein